MAHIFSVLIQLGMKPWLAVVLIELLTPQNSLAQASEKIRNRSESIFSNDTSQACTDLYIAGVVTLDYTTRWQDAYDTLKLFIETCPENHNAGSAFNEMSNAISRMDAARRVSMRAPHLQWLESVLYLDTIHDNYFCSDVEEIMYFLPLPADTLPGYLSRWLNIRLSVEQWLILNTTCDTEYLPQDYESARRYQRQDWLDHDRNYPLDTTLPPISTWGLDTLFARHFLYQHSDVKNPEPILTSCIAYPNPSASAAVLTFGMNQAGYVRIELLDVLGKAANGVRSIRNLDAYFDVGNHSVPIDMSALPSGNYYAQLTTAYRETRTVKLVKQ